MGRIAKSAVSDLFQFEKSLYLKGTQLIAGVDEAGRGCLAGPVVAAAVILPKNFCIEGLNDSKQLTALQREKFYEVILSNAVSFGIGFITAAEIDEINIHKASLKAMSIATEGLSNFPEHILVDGQFCIKSSISQTAIKHGDALSHSIAAASVVAKVTRDMMMKDFETKYPDFKFSIHKGYGTKRHRGEIKDFGPTPIHRRTFSGVIIA